MCTVSSPQGVDTSSIAADYLIGFFSLPLVIIPAVTEENNKFVTQVPKVAVQPHISITNNHNYFVSQQQGTIISYLISRKPHYATYTTIVSRNNQPVLH